MKNFRKAMAVILAVLAVSCLTAAVVLIIRQVRDYVQTSDGREEMQVSADGSQPETPPPESGELSPPGPSEPSSGESSSGESASPSPSETPESTPEPTPAPVDNPYRDSFLANSDMAAWLQIPDTEIDYPVMWTPEDEEYYLRRGFDGSKNSNGCLILDTDSCLEPLTTNLIIHGHNMKSGAMFGTLTDYKEEAFFQEHRTITLYTEECQRNYEVIAVFYSQVYKKTDQVFKFYKFFQADTAEEFDDFYRNIKELSLYDTGVTAEFGDCFLTLSTCAYHVENGRFVVVAKEVESGDIYLPIQN
ncbi:MAG: class B sortase [Butyrivibrio sp.]|nr:class B sortase [Acetatifactor muris]MCM1558234.1 class B sortase [Butyrivibrio sp.]